MEYWEYDKLGTAASMGCIRLNVANARWIFYNCEAGTPVTFYMDSNPGPLGKPASQKISSQTEYRGWDPTDPDPKNPWNNYNKPTPPKEDEKNIIENSKFLVIIKYFFQPERLMKSAFLSCEKPSCKG